MTDRARSVPASAFARSLRVGGVATGFAGATVMGLAGQVLRGQGADLGRAALTPANALRVAGGLSALRGAAMKLGQMLSMDSGLALPPEFSAPLAQLQANAPAMPPGQLKQVLARAWGPDWPKRFQRFDVRPLAAASIGQVHRAVTRDGRDLAIKVQFSGIARSIDSDIATLGRLMRLPGVLPRDVDVTPFLTAARAQLHDEADYQREARALSQFRAALGDAFIVPKVWDDLTTPQVLAMDYIDSQPIDTLAGQPQAARDAAMEQLITLTLRELFDLGQMQTDPNFANYRLAPDGRIVLLDFGATRDIAPLDAQAYRELLRAILAQDRGRMAMLMERIGYFRGDVPKARRDLILDLAEKASAPLRQDSPYDFGNATLVEDILREGAELGQARDFWHVPPAEMLFLHRKIAGMYLLGQRLRARVALRPLVVRWS
ncbi:ABC1 kinase family protein [Roseibaca sp. Y0-43]|uniref:ABC1 kinase family protein n=1 Tax=Roseibaca sp. Y0-43 TaxID=2816854 RepID=UPI001D0C5C4F|nr:AarF/ABC1/UbiB kinase family protein [Roseibaca sp. Y0-43]MCC1480972.1 AarF/ABC1/UbiB kinase family protein [Roseibaca sp. Y0-43]